METKNIGKDIPPFLLQTLDNEFLLAKSGFKNGNTFVPPPIYSSEENIKKISSQIKERSIPEKQKFSPEKQKNEKKKSKFETTPKSGKVSFVSKDSKLPIIPFNERFKKKKSATHIKIAFFIHEKIKGPLKDPTLESKNLKEKSIQKIKKKLPNSLVSLDNLQMKKYHPPLPMNAMSRMYTPYRTQPQNLYISPPKYSPIPMHHLSSMFQQPPQFRTFDPNQVFNGNKIVYNGNVQNMQFIQRPIPPFQRN